MRNSFIILLIVLVTLSISCGKSSQPGSETQADQSGAAHNPDKKAPEQGNPQRKQGAKPQGSGEDIDIDKLDIPEQMKEAIKSGKIPKERVQEYLANARKESNPGGGEARLVNVEPVERKNLNSYLVLNGIVEPERKVEIYSRLSAYVKQIVKEEGAFVKENDILALLDDTEIRISYQQSKIQLDQAKLSLDEAEANLERSKELIKKDLISEQEFQTTEATYKQRKLDHDNRKENFKDLELQLNWTKIRSLSEGYITERLIEVGSRVNSNQQVYTIEDFSPLLIRVYVPTSDATQLQTGMKTEVTSEVLQGAKFSGAIKLINPRIDVQSGTVKVTVEVFDESLRLKPGMFVEARIIIGQKENILVIPRKAILFKQNKTFVFVLNQDLASQREITLGLTEEDHVEVTNGLEVGEIIVVVGVEALKDGQRVEVVQ